VGIHYFSNFFDCLLLIIFNFYKDITVQDCCSVPDINQFYMGGILLFSNNVCSNFLRSAHDLAEVRIYPSVNLRKLLVLSWAAPIMVPVTKIKKVLKPDIGKPNAKNNQYKELGYENGSW